MTTLEKDKKLRLIKKVNYTVFLENSFEYANLANNITGC